MDPTTLESIKQYFNDRGFKSPLLLEHPICNPYSGESIYFFQSDTSAIDRSEHDSLQFIYTLEPGGKMPLKHLHPIQTETFEVILGCLTMQRIRDRVTITAGNAYTVNPGETHCPMNHSDQIQAVVLVTVFPAQNFKTNLETIFGLAAEGNCDRKGKPSFLQLIAIMNRYPDIGFIPWIPTWIQRLVAKLLAPVSARRGYLPSYERFSQADRTS
ncbi:MAG: cupin domain-containing protein [Planctomycetota bacterium]